MKEKNSHPLKEKTVTAKQGSITESPLRSHSHQVLHQQPSQHKSPQVKTAQSKEVYAQKVEENPPVQKPIVSPTNILTRPLQIQPSETPYQQSPLLKSPQALAPRFQAWLTGSSRTSTVDPNLCTITFDSNQYKATVQAFDSNVRRFITGGATVTAQHDTALGIYHYTGKDNDDGTYTFDYNNVLGTLQVEINGKLIKGSPFHIIPQMTKNVI